jgi:hypothetical protein
LVVWLSLAVAAVSSSVFLLRSLGPLVVLQAKKQAAMLLGAVGYVRVHVLLAKIKLLYSLRLVFFLKKMFFPC